MKWNESQKNNTDSMRNNSDSLIRVIKSLLK